MKITVIKNSCEYISVELIKEIERRKEKHSEVEIGIGLETDEYFVEKYSREPLRPCVEREKLAMAIEGVSFVIPIISAEMDSRMIEAEEVRLETEEVKK